MIGSPEELAAWRDARAAAGGDALPGAALHVDTGMNRLGFAVDDARFLPLAGLQDAGVTLVMSHLVSAEDPAEPVNARQIADFDHASRARLSRDFRASLANSSGVFLRRGPVHDLLRPGYALFGGNPTPGSGRTRWCPVVRAS